jgi:hypothetical protein
MYAYVGARVYLSILVFELENREMSRRNEVKQMSVKHGHPAILFINHS